MNFSKWLIAIWTSMAWCQLNSSSRSNNTLSINESSKCIDSSKCSEVDVSRCDCLPHQFCAQTERTCFTCPKPMCYDLKSNNTTTSYLPIVSGLIATLVILSVMMGGMIFYFKNRHLIRSHGGVKNYLKSRKQIPSRQASVSRSNISRAPSTKSRVPSTKSRELSTKSQVIKEPASKSTVSSETEKVFDPNESHIEIVNSLVRTQSKKSDYRDSHPLPAAPERSLSITSPESVHRLSVNSEPNPTTRASKFSSILGSNFQMGNRLTSYLPTSKFNSFLQILPGKSNNDQYDKIVDGPVVSVPSLARTSRFWDPESDSGANYGTDASFMTQILSNPLVENAIGPDPRSQPNSFFRAPSNIYIDSIPLSHSVGISDEDMLALREE